MKKASTVLRVFAAIFAGIFVLAAALLLMVRLCFLDEERYVDSILVDEFYEELEKERSKSFDALGTMIELEDGVLDKYASVQECSVLAEKYVNALVSDLMNGTKTASKIKFSATPLLNYLKADYAGYDFSQSGFASSDAAAEAAYTMICDRVNTAVLFVPAKISNNLGVISRLFNLVSDISFFWFVFLIIALIIYAALIFGGGDRVRNLFGAAASFWCGAVICFVPVLILYLGSKAEYLDFDRNMLYCFLSGCVNAVRGAAILFVSVYLALATGLVTVAGLKFTARRRIPVSSITIAEDDLPKLQED